MKVRAGAKPGGGGKIIEVELEDADVQGEVPGWATMTLRQRFRIMSEKADLLVIEYMVLRGDISKEFAAQRIREIKDNA